MSNNDSIRDDLRCMKNCKNLATKICDRCKLVPYCSKECQIKHWSEHKIDCKSPLSLESWRPGWAVQNRAPAFVGPGPPYEPHGPLRYLWGNMPAADILNLEGNEGQDYQTDLAICFAASGDLRNVVKTVNDLLTSHTAVLSVHVNDRDVHVVFRNILILLVLTLAGVDLHKKSDCAIHLWYSASLTREHQTILEEHVLPLVVEVNEKIKTKPDHSLQAKTITQGQCSVRIILQKSEWSELQQLLSRKVDSGEAQASRLDIVLHRKDHLDRDLFSKQPYERVARFHFRTTGVLLPFAANLDQHIVPNNTLFDAQGYWLQKDSADPLDGWLLADVRSHYSNHSKPRHDIYGQLYFYLLVQLGEFSQRCTQKAIKFVITASDLSHLQKLITNVQFDRIDVSNVVDTPFLGVEATLKAVKLLLRRDNSHATITSLFMNAIGIMEQSRKMAVLGVALKRVQEFMPLTKRPSGTHDPEFIRYMVAADMFLPFDVWFAEYLRLFRVQEIAEMMGLRMKSKNTVLQEWPMRLIEVSDKQKSQQMFDELLASSFTGAERYVEWKLE